MGQYVGIDLHRRSTTIVRMAEDGEVLGTERFVSQPSNSPRPWPPLGPSPRWSWRVAASGNNTLHKHSSRGLILACLQPRPRSVEAPVD